jgi:hypothetical protein
LLNLEDTLSTVFTTASGGRHWKACKTVVSSLPILCNCGRGSPGSTSLSNGTNPAVPGNFAGLLIRQVLFLREPGALGLHLRFA